MYKNSINCILIFLLVITSTNTFSQTKVDYQKVFGEKYSDALNYIQHNGWISDTLARYGIDPHLAISIVFPELIRYSSIQDKIETYSLEVLYVQYSDKYADFSIGRFQIKPSFANQIEKDWIRREEYESKPKIYFQIDTIDQAKNRILRIKRLKDQYWQVRYLIMFIILNEGKVKEMKEPKDQLEYLASAYNVGYWFDREEILLKGKQNYFHTNIFQPENCLNYKDIAIDFYIKQKPK